MKALSSSKLSADGRMPNLKFNSNLRMPNNVTIIGFFHTTNTKFIKIFNIEIAVNMNLTRQNEKLLLLFLLYAISEFDPLTSRFYNSRALSIQPRQLSYMNPHWKSIWPNTSISYRLNVLLQIVKHSYHVRSDSLIYNSM